MVAPSNAFSPTHGARSIPMVIVGLTVSRKQGKHLVNIFKDAKRRLQGEERGTESPEGTRPGPQRAQTFDVTPRGGAQERYYDYEYGREILTMSTIAPSIATTGTRTGTIVAADQSTTIGRRPRPSTRSDQAGTDRPSPSRTCERCRRSPRRHPPPLRRAIAPRMPRPLRGR